LYFLNTLFLLHAKYESLFWGSHHGPTKKNLDQKSTVPPDWGVGATGQPPAHKKKKEN